MFRCGLYRNFSLYKPFLLIVEQGIRAYDHKSCTRLTHRFGLLEHKNVLAKPQNVPGLNRAQKLD